MAPEETMISRSARMISRPAPLAISTPTARVPSSTMRVTKVPVRTVRFLRARTGSM
jgi:hypothetical protein